MEGEPVDSQPNFVLAYVDDLGRVSPGIGVSTRGGLGKAAALLALAVRDYLQPLGPRFFDANARSGVLAIATRFGYSSERLRVLSREGAASGTLDAVIVDPWPCDAHFVDGSGLAVEEDTAAPGQRWRYSVTMRTGPDHLPQVRVVNASGGPLAAVQLAVSREFCTYVVDDHGDLQVSLDVDAHLCGISVRPLGLGDVVREGDITSYRDMA